MNSLRAKGVAFLSLVVAFATLPRSFAVADVRIYNMDDIALPQWNGMSEVSADDGVCIFNSAGSDYTITATGTGGGGSFELQSGGNALSYILEFKGSVGSFTALTAGNSENFSAADESSDTCGGTTNATIRIRVPQLTLLGASRGTYTGSISFTVAPN